MPYIIDGNNLMGCSPDFSLEDPEAREKILYVVRKFQSFHNNNVIVVFDGEPQQGVRLVEESSKFSVVYPYLGNSADDEIKDILERLNYYKDVTLVTSDRELKSFAKKKGAKTINCIEFYFELKRFSHITGKQEDKQRRIETGLSENEVDQWLKIFDK